MEEEEALPDHLRCKRTDGRKWRCNRRVIDGKKLCETHHLQGLHRSHKQRVPDSLKIKRKKFKKRNQIQGSDENQNQNKNRKNEVRVRKRVRGRHVGISEALDGALKKMRLKRGDLQLELIRMFLKRQVEKRKERELRKNGENEAELMRELPNGIMAISPSLSQQNVNNADNFCNVKVGFDLGFTPKRCFRSKNIEPIPFSTMQIVPYAQNVAKLRKRKRKKCHWCRRSNYRRLIRCSSCKRECFCLDCIGERLHVMQEIKISCPVCRRTCCCRACSRNQYKDNEHTEPSRNERKVDKLQYLHYMVCLLLPVLEQINKLQRIELELEAKIKGETISEIQIEQAEFSCSKLQSCNNCKVPVVDFYRSCRNCSYNLCLSCSEFFRGSLPGGTSRSETCIPDDMVLSELKKKNTSRTDSSSRYLASPVISPKWKAFNNEGSIICPPVAFGGCDDGLLDLKCVFPLHWTKKLEESAEQIVCSYDFPEALDASSCCSLCKRMDKARESQLLQEVASREDSNDNFLYCPTVQDLSDENLEHFQKHWGKGHPVIVRKVLKSTTDLSWDPIVMFNTYLEKSSIRSRNSKEAIKTTDCLDWCEIEICSKQIFMGSLEGLSHANMRYEMLKLKAWLSPSLFQEQFPDHHAEIVHALPLQDYMNPASGVLNLAVNMPEDMGRPELGPCVHISFGSPEDLMQADFVTKLCYDSHDIVNILVHTTDVPVSAEQLSKLKDLMKKYNARDHKEPARIASDQKVENSAEEKSSVLSNYTEDSNFQDMIEEGFPLANGMAKISLFSGDSQKSSNLGIKDATSGFSNGHDSKSDSEASILCSIQNSEESENQNIFQDSTESPSCSGEESLVDFCGAQWDIFRRQDVPKLLEYLSKHAKAFTRTNSFQKHVHPILDQRFYLDEAHKMRLKKEFNVEPWTFEQNLGEAVIIPAGCPYQIKKLKSCVNVTLDFVSPENATECINLVDELRLLPIQHKARKRMLEVKKMALCSICKAVREINSLTSLDSSTKASGEN
ncbi:hypothetical protein NMG60_11022336 [Bertholletia excelsa]